MSVKEIARLFEKQSVTGTGEHGESGRQSTESFVDNAEDIRSSVSPRHGLGNDQPKNPRPSAPKSKSISGPLVTVAKDIPAGSEELELTSVRDGGKSTTLDLVGPRPVDEGETATQLVQQHLQPPAANSASGRRSSSPLRVIQAGFSTIRFRASNTLDKTSVPKVFRTVSDDAQTALRQTPSQTRQDKKQALSCLV